MTTHEFLQEYEYPLFDYLEDELRERRLAAQERRQEEAREADLRLRRTFALDAIALCNGQIQLYETMVSGGHIRPALRAQADVLIANLRTVVLPRYQEQLRQIDEELLSES